MKREHLGCLDLKPERSESRHPCGIRDWSEFHARVLISSSYFHRVIIARLRRKCVSMPLQQHRSIQRGLANNLVGELILLRCYPLLFLMTHHCSPY